MPIQTTLVEVVLAGLDQKTAAKLQAPGKLERAENVEYDKAGELAKRAGYLMLETSQADSVAMPVIASRVALDGDELLVMSTGLAFAMEDPNEALQTDTFALKLRGVVGRGAVSTFDVITSPDAEED